MNIAKEKHSPKLIFLTALYYNTQCYHNRVL